MIIVTQEHIENALHSCGEVGFYPSDDEEGARKLFHRELSRTLGRIIPFEAVHLRVFDGELAIGIIESKLNTIES